MRKEGFLILFLALLFIFPLNLLAQPQEALKIAVIDIKRVVNTSKYGQEVMEKLQKKYEELQSQLEAKGKEIEALKEEIEKKSQLWAQEVREKKQAEFQKKLRELKTLQEDAQMEMQEYEKKLLDPIFKELEEIIKSYVEKEKFDLLFERSQPGIYYASPRIDISPQIVDIFNKYYEEKSKTPRETLKKEPEKTSGTGIKEAPKKK